MLCIIVGQRDVVLKNAQLFGANVKQAKMATHLKLEEVLLMWFHEATAAGISVDGKVLCRKADNIALSRGLHHFKERHGLVYRVVSGEAKKVGESQVNDWLKTLPALILDYGTPERSLCVKGQACKGGQESKERVTVLSCANPDCSEKILPTVIALARDFVTVDDDVVTCGLISFEHLVDKAKETKPDSDGEDADVCDLLHRTISAGSTEDERCLFSVRWESPAPGGCANEKAASCGLRALVRGLCLRLSAEALAGLAQLAQVEPPPQRAIPVRLLVHGLSVTLLDDPSSSGSVSEENGGLLLKVPQCLVDRTPSGAVYILPTGCEPVPGALQPDLSGLVEENERLRQRLSQLHALQRDNRLLREQVQSQLGTLGSD
ncbi:hypothetical protein HPB52_021706 [Rhipicephalus sanguineus]|uniref:Uncharacterized protein n=1 Tax=Rhipicephalus sanguineus TaxID=34632 RepID=A0A9D4Q8B5_RHISA|nr:hypothetical protein HPB52_021706 [Rhipicephalus sanguineus]